MHVMNAKLILKRSFVFLVTAYLQILFSVDKVQAVPADFTQIQPLKFGLIVPGAAGGTVTVSETGAVSTTGSVTYLGGADNATVLMDSCLLVVASNIVLTPGPLTGTGFNITMNQLTCISPGNASSVNSCGAFVGTLANDLLFVGGTITLPPGQTPGFYSGTFDIVGENAVPCP